MKKNFFFFLRWYIILIRFQLSNSDWKCCLSAFLSRILTPSQTSSRPQQDGWMVLQCRFISIQIHPLALLVPGHPWGVNPLSVSSQILFPSSIQTCLFLHVFQRCQPQGLKFLEVSDPFSQGFAYRSAESTRKALRVHQWAACQVWWSTSEGEERVSAREPDPTCWTATGRQEHFEVLGLQGAAPLV